MAQSALRPCGWSNCRTLTSGTFCTDHRRSRPQKKQVDTKTPEQRAFYSSWAWTQASRSHRRQEPLCRECARHGKITAGEIVDHIIRIKDGADPWDRNNWQTLCAGCHDRKRGKERHGK